MLGTKHNSNRELIGQGLGNIVSSLVGGIPVSGAVVVLGQMFIVEVVPGFQVLCILF